jgi:outer membrane autotransporter protein
VTYVFDRDSRKVMNCMKKLTATLLLSVAVIAAVSGSAIATDLMTPAQPAPVMAAPSVGWDGLYIGGNVGYSWGTATNSTSAAESENINGFSLGAEIGYNLALSDSIVAGVEGDLNWSNEGGNNASAGESFRINWDGAVLGRLGFDGGQFMPYVEAGVGFENGTQNFNTPSVSVSQTGYVLGAGVQFQLIDQLTGNVEYRYANYGTANFFYGIGPNPYTVIDSSIRFGLDYHLK